MKTHAIRVLDRTVRTIVQVVIAYLVAAPTLGGVDWRTAGAAAALAAVVSLLQGLVDLPPLSGGWLQNALGRALRTFAQTALGFTAAAVLVTQVPWDTVLAASALAAVTSILTSLATTQLGPPGTPEIVGPAPAHT